MSTQDDIGRVILDSNDLINLILNENNINGLLASETDESIKFNRFSETDKLLIYNNDLESQNQEDYDHESSNLWFTPQEYQEINLSNWLLSRCSNDLQKNRVIEELNMYEERNLFPLLQHLIYLVDHFRKNNIVWGIGRGSSVASYILFLISIHKVDSILYDLDIREFLR